MESLLLLGRALPVGGSVEAPVKGEQIVMAAPGRGMRPCNSERAEYDPE